MLLHNLTHGMMSNIENSLYLWDLSHCQNKLTKNVIIDWSIDVLLNKTTIFKNYPVILVTMQGRNNFENAEIIKVGEYEVKKHNNLIIVDATPMIRGAKFYKALKAAENSCEFLLNFIKDV